MNEMKLHLKNRIKQFSPPILLNIVKDYKNYYDYLKYKNIVKRNTDLKNIHAGNRCFLLGSGPSIKDEDLKPLKNEIVFALNNFYVHEDFYEIMSGDVEKYYMTAPIHPPQTQQEWTDWYSDMEKNIPNNAIMIFGISNRINNTKKIIDQHNLFTNHQRYWYYSGINITEYYEYRAIDIDITKMIWIADTISIYSLIVAIYMGFSEIYLLGMDHNHICNNESNYRFYQNGIHQNNESERELGESSFIKHVSLGIYKVFSQYELLSNNSNSKIYNTSRNSLLDVFDFLTLSESIK